MRIKLLGRWRRAVVTAVVVVGIVAAFPAAVAILRVHSDANEYRWLRVHARTGTYRVIELGEQEADGKVQAVWVRQPGLPQSFVDLHYSHQSVTELGQGVSARIDNRDAPGTSYGVAADALHRSFTRDYLKAAWPLSATALALGMVLAELVRRLRASSGAHPLLREQKVSSGLHC